MIYKLLFLPTVITAPGRYRTRSGEIVAVTTASRRFDFGCTGHYENGTPEAWHKSGRLLERETQNDIVAPVV